MWPNGVHAVTVQSCGARAPLESAPIPPSHKQAKCWHSMILFCISSCIPKPILRSVWSFVHKSLICWPPLPEKLIDSLEIVDGCGTWTPGDLKDDLSRNFWRHEENGDYPMDEMRFPNIFRFQTPNPAFRIYQVLPCPAMFWRYHKSLQTRGIHNRFASQVLRTSLGCRWHWC